MSRNKDILVGTEQSLTDLTTELEVLLGSSARHVTSDDETWYELEDRHTFLSVGDHAYVNDQGIDFESYQYDIQVYAINIQSPDERVRWLYESARMIFNKLRETRKYSLLLVDNLQVELDKYHPTEMHSQ
jgi:hypothetical protein